MLTTQAGSKLANATRTNIQTQHKYIWKCRQIHFDIQKNIFYIYHHDHLHYHRYPLKREVRSLRRAGREPRQLWWISPNWLSILNTQIQIQIRINIARIANAVHCHSCMSGNKDCHEFRFSVLRIVISVSIVTSLQDCLVLQGGQVGEQVCRQAGPGSGHVFSTL